jgi:hypothetical protein
MNTEPRPSLSPRQERYRRTLASVARWGISNESTCHEAPVPTKPLLSEVPTNGSYYEISVDAETGNIAITHHVNKE